MRGTLKSVGLVVGCIGSLAACAEDVDSKNIKTDGMYADFRVTGRENGRSEVRANIRIGGGESNTYAELSDGDELSATSGDDTMVLTETGSGDAHIYHATFDGADEGQLFTVSFDRADDESAPDSHAGLPAPFTITAPGADAAVSRASALTVTWAPSTSDSASISMNGDCIVIDGHSDSSDTGSHTFAADSIHASAGHETETCDVELTVTTRVAGAIDPAFGEGGKFDAIQERTIHFRSTP